MEPAPYPSSSSARLFSLDRRRLPDDTVFYAVYPDLPADLPAPDALAALRTLHLQLHSLLSPLFSSYIWHRDPFLLSLPDSHLSSPCPFCASPPVPHLHGRTHFADSLADEWLVVSLLFTASRAIPSLSARAWDSDGEFLLIEAAFSLPRWLTPDSSPNRVFIRCGELHIVPKDGFPANPSLEVALDAVRSDIIDTRASDAVQAAIQRCIAGYPERARENIHRVRARVPAPVAQVLKVEPCLISLAVEGFYDRDLDSMKHASRMERFLKVNGGDIEMVRVSVTMSRAMYAQLVRQSFLAPRLYPMPSREEGPIAYAEAELGMKIACGFEMMYQEKCRAFEEGKGSTWEAFKQSLESSGCFEGLVPGSKEYQRILEDSLQYYKSTALFSRTREIMTAPVRRIDEILSLPYSASDFESIELPPNDDDSWLYDGEDELNTVLAERQKELDEYEASRKHRKNLKKKAGESDSNSLSNDFNVGDIAETMQEFVRKVSSFEGAEVPENRNSKSVELDADQFFKDLESVLGGTSHKGTASDDDNEVERRPSSSSNDFDDAEDESDSAEDISGVGDDFMQLYSDALTKELCATSLKKSFIRAENSDNNNEGSSNAVDGMDEDLTPVDVNLNLVESFLNSFSSQQGLPGPASNLLGLMGINIPPDANSK